MLLKKIRLENIRSYLAEEINFPESSVLLSGNIGSGKSTILIAIDFVLFGLSPGMGSALLRNGQERGNVILHFEIDNKNIVIKRTIKRTSTGVTQDSGYLIINNQKMEGTATELKAKIIEILNYPKELLTKSKSLIYKYTVYTPQEEMKTILLSDKDSRLETLRKVFGIDKYKRITQNSELFLKQLKNKTKEFEIRIETFDSKTIEKQEKEKKLEKIIKEIKEIQIKYEDLSLQLNNKKQEIINIEEETKQRNQTKNKLELEQNNLKNTKEKLEREENENTELKNEINSLEEELKEKEEENIEELTKKKIELNQDISKKESKIQELQHKKIEFNTIKSNHENLKQKITDLDKCPYCEQDVKQDHKYNIIKREKEQIENITGKINNLDYKIKNNQEELNSLKQELESHNEVINDVNLISLKFKNLKEKKSKYETINQNISRLKNNIEENKNKIDFLEKELNKFENLEEKYSFLRQEIEGLINQDKAIGIKKATLEQNELELNKSIQILQKDIEIMQRIKSNLDYFKQLQKWISEVFIKMMQLMEKKIMLRAHSDFSSLFEKWFGMLVDNEISIKLDEEFTPIITINGYETDYAHLSGGERTAAALAYRLALNQVINNLMSDIKTRDLIILDEPTDGFSTDQLDKVKLVLDELNLKQIIIVSHEPKIESFVDSVLRFEKKEHVSRIIN